MREHDDTTNERGPEPGDRVGLGRVVEDHRTPSRDPGRPADEAGDDEEEDGIGEASEESFPASDPPTFRADRATTRDR